MGFLTLGAIEHLNKNRVHVTLFSAKPQDDDYARRFMAAADAVIELSNMSDEDAAQTIAETGVDILIDMGGHSNDGRLLVMARKPAPIQVKWAGGQHGTTGLAAIDYFLTDSIETPPEHDPCFVETPVRLPNAYGVYSPPPDALEGYDTSERKTDPLTFDCFNNLAKASDGAFSAWAKILESVHESKLVLKNDALQFPEVRRSIEDKFQDLGIAPTRLELRPPTDHLTHLRAYHDIDIALDPFP